MPTKELWRELKDGIFKAVEGKGRWLLDQSAEARALVLERAERLAKLMEEYAFEKDEAKRKALLADAAIVKQTIENEISALAVQVSAEGRALFMGIVSTAFETVIKVLPGLL